MVSNYKKQRFVVCLFMVFLISTLLITNTISQAAPEKSILYQAETTPSPEYIEYYPAPVQITAQASTYYYKIRLPIIMLGKDYSSSFSYYI